MSSNLNNCLNVFQSYGCTVEALFVAGPIRRT